MTAGYSHRSLADKLGIKPGFRVAVHNFPGDYAALVGVSPETVRYVADSAGEIDLIHYFTTDGAQLARDFPGLKQRLAKKGALWVSWPKAAARVPSDVTGDGIRRVGLAHGLVDVKVCAVDAVWSGLKFVYRVADRAV